MKKYHCLGFVVQNGRCKVACYDVVNNQVLVMPSLDWAAIKDEICTSLEAESLVNEWKKSDCFDWTATFSKMKRGDECLKNTTNSRE